MATTAPRRFSEYQLEVRTRHPRAYDPGSDAEDQRVIELHASGRTAVHIAAELERQPQAILARFERLGLATHQTAAS
ncbi:MAG: hypothetical protein HY873_11205 [Chloroflexi bacterium]|nr:hypothetical protein [Chloroflexota bacterium]